LATLPQLPQAIDADTTARWIEAALAGQGSVPPSIERQIELLLLAVARMPVSG
jgi:hypothetical protein